MTERSEAGHTVFTRSTLRIYDLGAMAFSARFVWRCPSPRTLDLFHRHLTGNHLDVGVGTGEFLVRCRWPVARPRIGLMDANVNCLEEASRRLARFRPEAYQANILDGVPAGIGRFDSISLMWVLQCLPGTLRTKAVAIRNLLSLLNPGGVLFGATLLQGEVHRSWLARRFMDFYNTRGIFSNREDDLDGLRALLADHFERSGIEVVGCGALFWGRVAASNAGVAESRPQEASDRVPARAERLET